MRTEGSIEIARPIAEVFAFTTEKVAEWSTIVVEDEVIGGKAVDVGTTFRTVTEDRGHRMTFDGRVILHDPPRAHAAELVGVQFDMLVEYSFEDLGGSTRVQQVSHVRPKGMMKLFFGLFGWLMRKGGCQALEKELQNLKRLLEAAP